MGHIKKFITIFACILLTIIPIYITAETPILTKPTTTQSQCRKWMMDHDVEKEFIDLIPYIYKRAEEVGIDPTLIVSQAALETGYFTSYNLRTNHNTAGIKSRSNTNRYASYETYKDGFNAQICHIALYAGNHQDDYYYSERLDGWVTTIEGLDGTWAEDRNYSSKIKIIMNDIKSYKVEEDLETKTDNELKKEKDKVEVKKKPDNIIYNILSKKKKPSKAAQLLNSFLK